MRAKILLLILLSLIFSVLFVQIDGQSIPDYLASNYASLFGGSASSPAAQAFVPPREPSDVYDNIQRSAALSTLLLNRDFAPLEKEFEIDSNRPVKYWDGREYLHRHVHRWVYDLKIESSVLLPALNEWIVTNPESDSPLTIRGVAYEQYGWKARGSKFASKTKKEQFEIMYAMFEKSYIDLTQVVERNPNNKAAWYSLLGQTFHASTERKHNVDIFNQAITHHPNYYHIYRRKLETLNQRWGGHPGEALAFARYFSQQAPKGSYLPLLVVEAHEDIGNWLKHATPKRPRNNRNDTPLLKATFVRQVATDSDPDKFYANRAKYYAQPEVWAEITEAVNTVLASHPRFSYAMLMYAELAYDAKKYGIAYEYYKKALDVDPYYGATEDWRSHALLKLGREHYNRNLYDQSLAYYERYIGLYPEEIEGYKWAGYLRGVRKDYLTTERYYKKLIELDPTNVVFMTDYCSQLHNLNRFDEALPICEKAVTLDKDNAQAHSARAHVYTHLGRHEEAAADEKAYHRLIQKK